LEIIMTSQLIRLDLIEGEPRLDSRIAATEMGVLHKNVRELIGNYLPQFEELALLPFKTEAVKREGERGTKYEKFYLLNEDQTYFLMTLVRNTTQAVELKKRLVKAFAHYRTAAALPKPLKTDPDTITIPTAEYIGLLKSQIKHLQRAAQPRRQLLTTEEKTLIKKLHASGLGDAGIGRKIERPEGTVGSYLRRVRMGQDA
jgi:phage regulator Rha-like protein